MTCMDRRESTHYEFTPFDRRDSRMFDITFTGRRESTFSEANFFFNQAPSPRSELIEDLTGLLELSSEATQSLRKNRKCLFQFTGAHQSLISGLAGPLPKNFFRTSRSRDEFENSKTKTNSCENESKRSRHLAGRLKRPSRKRRSEVENQGLNLSATSAVRQKNAIKLMCLINRSENSLNHHKRLKHSDVLGLIKQKSSENDISSEKEESFD